MRQKLLLGRGFIGLPDRKEPGVFAVPFYAIPVAVRIPVHDVIAGNRALVGYRVSPGENPGGRPSVLESDPKLQERIAECFLLGLTDEQTALDCDISVRTVSRLRQGKFCPAVKRADLAREKIYRQKVWNGENGWQGTAWFWNVNIVRNSVVLKFS
jgi:hypothetical protein